MSAGQRTFTAEEIAKVIHGITSSLPRMDGSLPETWEELDPDRKAAATYAVETLITLPIKTASELHSFWMDGLRERGWTYAPEYSLDLKRHPSLVPFEDLNDSEVFKDEVWAAMLDLFRTRYKA